jgi:hypothetical protein
MHNFVVVLNSCGGSKMAVVMLLGIIFNIFFPTWSLLLFSMLTWCHPCDIIIYHIICFFFFLSSWEKRIDCSCFGLFKTQQHPFVCMWFWTRWKRMSNSCHYMLKRLVIILRKKISLLIIDYMVIGTSRKNTLRNVKSLIRIYTININKRCNITFC